MAPFVALKYEDAAKYWLETDHGLIASLAVISKSWFEGLPPDLQDVVVKAGQKASNDVYQFSVDDVNNGRERWKKAGGEVIVLSAADHDTLMQELAPSARRPQRTARLNARCSTFCGRRQNEPDEARVPAVRRQDSAFALHQWR